MSDSIVVIGGGITGYTAVKELEKKHGLEDVILIEPREYVEVPFAALRGLVDPNGIGRKMRRPWSEVAPVKRISASAVEIQGDQVHLSNGDTLSFAQAIIATGATWKAAPFIQGTEVNSIAGREAQFDAEKRRLDTASSVLIIGGGPIGVELAGELAETFPRKKIRLVQGGGALLPALSAGAGKKALRVLEKLGVEVRLNTRLEENAEGYVDESGNSYSADIIYPALGVRANPISLDDGSALDEARRLMVDENLRVAGWRNVFAVGDVNDVPEIKLGATGKKQAAVAVYNLLSLRSGGERRKSYKPSRPMGFVTLGKDAGIAQLPCFRFDPMIIIKQKDLMIDMFLGKRAIKS